MDRKAILFFLLAVVAASGCIDDPEGSFEETQEEAEITVAEFETSDEEVFGGQRFQAHLTLQNHGSQAKELDRVEVYNLNHMESITENNVEGACDSREIEPAFEGVPGDLECSWTIEAPEDLLHEDRQSSFNAIVEYDASVSTSQDPLQVEFRDSSEIVETERLTRTWTNNEVRLSASVPNPADVNGEEIQFGIEPVGEGTVTDNYELSYRPSAIFGDDCQSELDFTRDAASEFSCELTHSAETTVTEPLIVTAQYKYRRTPETTVRVEEP